MGSPSIKIPSILPAWRDGSGGRPPHFAWRRPHHTLKGRQDAAAIEASRERLADLKPRRQQGRSIWCFSRNPRRSRIPIWRAAGLGAAPSCASKRPARRKSGRCSGPSIHYAGACSCTPAPPSAPPTFVALLDQLGAAYGTTERTRPLVAVLDNGPIHTSKLTTRALAERPWLTLEWLPKYAPELNDIERCWRDLKQHQLANRTFGDADALAHAIPDAVTRLNHERQPKSSPIRRQAA